MIELLEGSCSPRGAGAGVSGRAMKAVPYGSVEYWSSRYDDEERDKPGGGFEWYPGADDVVVDLLSKLGGYDDGFEALEIGSGSSELAAKLAASFAGSHVILSDFAENVVHRMRERLGGKDLEFHVVDCCRMAYRDGGERADLCSVSQAPRQRPLTLPFDS